jgi:hypothetical protein
MFLDLRPASFPRMASSLSADVPFLPNAGARVSTRASRVFQGFNDEPSDFPPKEQIQWQEYLTKTLVLEGIFELMIEIPLI